MTGPMTFRAKTPAAGGKASRSGAFCEKAPRTATPRTETPHAKTSRTKTPVPREGVRR